MTDSVKVLARKSAAEVRRRGLYKGGMYYESRDWENCRACVIGAIAAAMGEPYQVATAEQHPLVKEIARKVGSRGRNHTPAGIVTRWSDDPNTTEVEVLAVLDTIAGD